MDPKRRPSSSGLLAVHAHPDDESITMGGTLARYAALGVPVTLVTATLGEEGEVMHAGRLGLDRLMAGTADQLGGYRLAELAAACRAMGVRDHRMLGGLGRFRDSGMAGSASAEHPRAFCRALTGGPDHDAAVAALAAVIEEVRPAVVLTYDSDGGYGHPDHVATHQVTVTAVHAVRAARRTVGDGSGDALAGGGSSAALTGDGGDDAFAGNGAGNGAAGDAVSGAGAAIRVLATVRPRSVFAAALGELWREHMPAGYRHGEPDDFGFLVPDDSVDIAVPVGPWRAARRAALGAHATQLDTWPGRIDGFALTNMFAQPLLGAEYYRVLSGPPVPSGAADLFAGLR